MKLYKSNLKLGNTEKVIVAANMTKETKKNETVEVDRLHFIHLLDRSYSMSSNLQRLMREVDETLDHMSDNDLISVIWFSGEGECRTLFKGKSKRDREDIRTLLDTLICPVGLTCFSEPLKEAEEIIEDLSALCSNFAVTLFTDGQPCVNDHDKEMKAIWSNMESLKEKAMAVNTIGYGNWYNQDLLEKIASYTPFGRFVHSNQIKEYSDIFSHTYDVLSNMVVEKIDMQTSEESEILYLSNKNTKYSQTELHLKFLNKTKNQFFFIFDVDKAENATITINDEIISLGDITKKIPAPTLNNMYYSLAYEYYYMGRAEESLDIMAYNTHDKLFIDNHINAFTADERKAHLESIEKAIFSNKLRYAEGEVTSDYVPADDAFSVMDLLKILAKGDNYYIPVSSEEYNRIGLKVTDTFNLFKSKKDHTPLAPLKDFIFNAKHLNISIRYMIEGEVSLNPIDAKKVDLPKSVDSRIYRTQTIIKDGILNVKEINTRLDKDTYSRLMKLHAEEIIILPDIILDLNTNFAEAEDGETTMRLESIDVKFDLTKLPVINRMYAKQSTAENILDNVKAVNILKARQKVFKYYVDQLKSKTYANKKSEGFAQFNADQIRLLESHGLNSKLDYQGVGLEKAEKNENDFYESRLLEFTLKGWSSLPKVDDVISGKKKNAPAKAMQDAIDLVTSIMENENLTDKDRLDSIANMLENAKQQILDRTIDINTQKISKVLTGGWWEGLEVDKKQNYTFQEGEDTLVIKNDMVKVYF